MKLNIYSYDTKTKTTEQLTSGSSAWKYSSDWLPVSKYLVYFDRTLILKLIDVEVVQGQKRCGACKRKII